MDTSEETSDTCVDDHHDVSSGPPSGPMDYFAAAAGIFKKVASNALIFETSSRHLL